MRSPSIDLMKIIRHFPPTPFETNDYAPATYFSVFNMWLVNILRINLDSKQSWENRTNDVSCKIMKSCHVVFVYIARYALCSEYNVV